MWKMRAPAALVNSFLAQLSKFSGVRHSGGPGWSGQKEWCVHGRLLSKQQSMGQSTKDSHAFEMHAWGMHAAWVHYGAV